MTSLRLERTLPATPEQVFRALTDPDALAAWFWPPDARLTVTADPRPGGRYRIAATGGPFAGTAIEGSYTLVEPPHRLAFTWRWDGDDAQTLVTIELTATPTGTALTLVHDGFAEESVRDNHAIGWSDCLDRLPGWLTA
ncbi:MAG: SRPBCC family protein [Micromonosporaceae bacterium]